MATPIKDVRIICQSCREPFEPRLFRLKTKEQYDSIITMGNREQCPACGHMTPCNTGNMFYVLADSTPEQKG